MLFFWNSSATLHLLGLKNFAWNISCEIPPDKITNARSNVIVREGNLIGSLSTDARACVYLCSFHSVWILRLHLPLPSFLRERETISFIW